MSENEKELPWWKLPATEKQRSVLKREGYDPNVNRRVAKEIIDYLYRKRQRQRGGA
jgi:hypothetical protein